MFDSSVHSPELATLPPAPACWIQALLPKLDNETNAAVASRILAALGELAQVAGEDMTQHIDQLLPRIIDTLQDQSSSAKRVVALQTLAKLCESTGHVIAPYLDHPNLLPLLIKSLKNEQQRSIRHAIIKVMGTLGALDPYRYKVTQLAVTPTEGQDVNTLDELLTGGPSRCVRLFAVVCFFFSRCSFGCLPNLSFPSLSQTQFG